MEHVLRSTFVSEMPSTGTGAAKERGTSCYCGAWELCCPRSGTVVEMDLDGCCNVRAATRKGREEGAAKKRGGVTEPQMSLRAEDRTTKVKHEQP